MTTPSQSEYDRGVAAGQVLSRLNSHDVHFDKINGSMDRVADELHVLTLSIQRLSDGVESDRVIARATAKAVEAADLARQSRSKAFWTPIQRLIAILGVAAAISSTLISYFVIYH